MVHMLLLSLALASQSPATAPSTAPSTASDSLLTNGGFEQKLEGWDGTKDGGMSSAKPEAAHSGEVGLRIDDTDDVKGASLGSVPLASEPGKKYEVTCWGRMLSGKNGFVHLQFMDAKKKTLNNKASGNEVRASIKGDQWTAYKIEGVAPPETAFVRVWIHSQNAGPSMFDVDDIVLQEVK